jgi:hypothetical protein
LVVPQKVFDQLHISNKKGYDSGKNIVFVLVFDAVINEGKKTKKRNGKGDKRSSCIETHLKLFVFYSLSAFITIYYYKLINKN